MGPLQLHTNVRESFQLLVRHLGLLQKEGAECCGISVIQSHVLYELGKRPNLSLNELSGILAIDTSTMSRQIQSLVEQKLVNRLPDPRDRRYVVLTLTKDGEEKQLETAKQMQEYTENIFSFLPEEKREQVLESLQLLSAAMRKSQFCCTPPM